jgi:phage FluMu protein Com
MSVASLRPTLAPSECRCVCGNLVARVVADGVELKCRRCKRVLLVAVPVAGLERGSVLRVHSASESG